MKQPKKEPISLRIKGLGVHEGNAKFTSTRLFDNTLINLSSFVC